MLPEKVPALRGLRRISRRRMAAPAAGVAKVHEVEQKAILAEAIEE
jgi:2-oxoglutarate decarboxylase